ncbi:hypothetical protein AJ80_04588 [Polytolypa hystricis UAMH7299]|uniref:RING-type domain-containing protein n=1 Tax=Polytolypa hystricis (strain UAMH7299) TaxID=1447883 RepID=A0A2B7YAW7_POLH7|nr:hypothetical protein AJ80_04588 [Polytolypa hystricis UAMH7299]
MDHSSHHHTHLPGSTGHRPHPQSAHTQSAHTNQDVATILGIPNTGYPFETCIGRAVTRNRRCRHLITLSNTTISMDYVAQANGLFNRNLDLKDLEPMLQNIASALLCQQNHQDQISEVVETWMRKLVDYRAERNRQRLALHREHGRLWDQAYIQSHIVLMNAQAANNAFRVPLVGPPDSNLYQHAIAQQLPYLYGLQPAIAKRRDIEEDCPICFTPLDQPPFSCPDSSTEKKAPSISVDADSVWWCKSGCGKNFHRSCMDEWIKNSTRRRTNPTCPNCRVKWFTIHFPFA